MKPLSPLAFAGLGCALLLAGCGGTTAGNTVADGATSTAETSASGGGKSPPADFKATDACALLDKAVVAEILKTPVTEAKLGLVHEASGSDSATSECTYETANGQLRFQARWSPIGDNTPDAMKLARNGVAATMKAFSDKPLEDIAGLGKSAFFVPGINQLNVFIGDDKFAVITTPGRAEGRETAIALARKIGA
jgi:hypothetical protein